MTRPTQWKAEGYEIGTRKWMFLLYLTGLPPLFIFQSSQDVSTIKVLFVLFFVSVSAYAMLIIRTSVSRASSKAPVVSWRFSFLSLIYTCVLLIAGGLALEKVRDALPYVMIGCAVPLGIALGQNLRAKHLVSAGIILGVVSSALTFVDWVNRRGASDLLTKLGLSSAILPALGLALAVWASFPSRPRVRFSLILVSAIILALMLATGNRTNLVMFLVFAPLLLMLGKRGPSSASSRSAIKKVFELGIVFGFVLALFYFLSFIMNLRSFLEFRFLNSIQVFLVDATSDQSFVLRAQYFDLGFNSFSESPLFGNGFSPFGDLIVQDTPMEGLAKIGVFGTLLFTGIFFELYRMIIKSRGSAQLLKPAFQGWTLVVIALVPFGTVWQDKGLPISLVLVAAMAQATLSKSNNHLASDDVLA